MPVEEKVEFEGEAIEALRTRMFRVRLDNGQETLGYTAGKMRRHRIKVFLGDRVRIELTPHDLTRGRIVCAPRRQSTGTGHGVSTHRSYGELVRRLGRVSADADG